MGSAEGIARRIVEEMGDFHTPLSGLTRLVKRFSAFEFDVPDLPDADGYLFQYGKVNWLPEPTFVMGVVRQLEIVDAAGQHERYVQVNFELRYQMDANLDSVGNYSEWWFPGDVVSFDSWLGTVDRAQIASRLVGHSPRDFIVFQDVT
ncbi:hypothetical protein QUV83_13510 [Cellulomonas cellasea]|uniref:hypothetical protein n=1 Tax=Cellulomonas cellasea TaxID=43670 RepID=UPI0025A3FBB0|nr:hypothetical protein [Cellulomonas cellasea]MDM8085788.1 hypothetical protein [Cellulomonas cellasea]